MTDEVKAPSTKVTVLVAYSFVDGTKMTVEKRVAVPLTKDKDGNLDLLVFFHPDDGYGNLSHDHVMYGVKKGTGLNQYQDITGESQIDFSPMAIPEDKPVHVLTASTSSAI